jgi:hypothetical protein
MRMRWRSSIAVAGAIATVLAARAGAAAPPDPCDVGPSSFFDVFVGDLDDDRGVRTRTLEWTARTSTTVDCSGMGVIPIDVWEHAVIALRKDENGDGDFDDPGEGRSRGRCQIVIDFTSAGVTVPFEGTVRGEIDGVQDDADIFYVMRATSPRGAHLELRHVGKLDLVNGMLDSLDLDDGALVH